MPVQSENTGKVAILKLEAKKRCYSCLLKGAEKPVDLSVETVSEFSLCQGKELTRSRWAQILAFERRQGAIAKARNALARRPLSRSEVRAKLKDLSPLEIEKALDQLEGEGLIDDRALADELAQEYAAKGLAGSAIVARLVKRGISSNLARQILPESEPSEEVAYQAVARALGSARSLSRRLAQRKAYAQFAARGFDSSACHSLSERLVGEVFGADSERERVAMLDNLRACVRQMPRRPDETLESYRTRLYRRLVSRGFTPSEVIDALDKELCDEAD